MFSGRVSKGTWPRMTIRSKQSYTKASGLPNSFAKGLHLFLPLTLASTTRSSDKEPMEIKISNNGSGFSGSRAALLRDYQINFNENCTLNGSPEPMPGSSPA